ncbi:hypothetical protein LMG28614_05632 [Paraburkholderia ultramafica]|uniref:Uncharacterized protein n=1 Tax=Paraburkholderia ultramafica TaxID=1544867 RepID=A0A6S7BTX4_9BURK|nr:hypothetical protein [Paraburkholderia ultramafica]CAB3802528.1 hypothetical protein LMG28614_05632 [Paraburkholderia ultramafica]
MSKKNNGSVAGDPAFREALLREAIQRGEDDIAAGRTKPYTPALTQEITERAMKRAQAGDQPKADVTPSPSTRPQISLE